MFRMIIALAAAAACAPAASAAPVVRSQGPAAISNAQQFVLGSAYAKRDFLVQVAAPVRVLKPGEKAAVIYVLDGDYMFGMAADVARNLQIVREIEPVYVVGIGYPGDVHADWVLGRLRDMLDQEREVRGFKAGGGGAGFRRFLLDEVAPFIQGRFPVDASRSYLHGHSLGGLFAASILAERPNVFAGYAIGSPSIWIEPTILDRLQKRVLQAPQPSIYVGVGSEEREEDMVEWARRLAQTLRDQGHAVEHRVFDKEGHVSVEGVLYANALKYLIPAAPQPPKP